MAELDWLQQTMQSHPTALVVLMMHHPPVASIGSAHYPESALFNPRCREALARTLRPFQGRVHGIFCGHIHQEFSGILAGTR